MSNHPTSSSSVDRLPSLDILPLSLAATLKNYNGKSKARKLRFLVIFFEHISEGATDKKAVAEAGISTTTFRNWRRKDAAFAQLVQLTREAAADAMKAEIISMSSQSAAAVELAAAKIRAAAPAAADTLEEIATSKSSLTKEADRVRAATALLNRVNNVTGAQKADSQQWQVLTDVLRGRLNVDDIDQSTIEYMIGVLLELGAKLHVDDDGRLTLATFHTDDPAKREEIKSVYTEALHTFYANGQDVIALPLDTAGAGRVKPSAATVAAGLEIVSRQPDHQNG